jgi:hypothetical protein
MTLVQSNPSNRERVSLLGYLLSLLIATWRGYEANEFELAAKIYTGSVETLAGMKATGIGHALDDVRVYLS